MKMIKTADPRKKFNMINSAPFSLFGYGATKALVESVFMNEFESWLGGSPFFRDKKDPNTRGFKGNIALDTGSSITDNVGRNVFCAVMEEIQREVRHEQLKQNYDSLTMRIQSRFDLGSTEVVDVLGNPIKDDHGNVLTKRNYFGLTILVGSAGSNENFCEYLTEKSREDPGILICDPAQWEVLGGSKRNYSGETFPIFIGDDSADPGILTKDELAILQGSKPELIKMVPIEYYDNFQSDIYQAIRDIAGISTRSQYKFFQSLAKVVPMMGSANWFSQDVIKVSFYNRNDKLVDKINLDVFNNRSNPKQPRFIHIDIGYASDLTGISCVHIDGFRSIERSDLVKGTKYKIKEPIYKVDFSVGVGRYPGEE